MSNGTAGPLCTVGECEGREIPPDFDEVKNYWFCPKCGAIYEDHGEHPDRDKADA